MKHILSLLILSCLLIPVMGVSRAPVEPLEKRLKEANLVFVGEITKSIEENGWVLAELKVTSSLKGLNKTKTVNVILGKYLMNPKKFIVGSKGIVILSDQHKARYWFRDDKFEDLDKLKEVKKLLGVE